MIRGGAGHPGYYVIIGAMAGEPGYPTWLRPYLSLLVSAVWAVSNFVSAATSGRWAVPLWTHLIMGGVVVSLFRVTLGNIHFDSHREDNKK